MDSTSEKLLTQLVSTFKQWIEDLQQERELSKEHYKRLEKASELIEAQNKSVIDRLTPWIPLLTMVVIGIVVIVIMIFAPCGISLTFQDLEVSKTCPISN